MPDDRVPKSTGNSLLDALSDYWTYLNDQARSLPAFQPVQDGQLSSFAQGVIGGTLGFTGSLGPGTGGAAMNVVKGVVNPAKLAFRESMQNNLSNVRDMFPDGGGYTPIVTIGEGKTQTILDGHNRAAIALERGDDLPYVSIPKPFYDALKKGGYDDMEISYAALSHAGEDEAASQLAQQFPGSSVADRGMKAWNALDDLIP